MQNYIFTTAIAIVSFCYFTAVSVAKCCYSVLLWLFLPNNRVYDKISGAAVMLHLNNCLTT